MRRRKNYPTEVSSQGNGSVCRGGSGDLDMLRRDTEEKFWLTVNCKGLSLTACKDYFVDTFLLAGHGAHLV